MLQQFVYFVFLNFPLNPNLAHNSRTISVGAHRVRPLQGQTNYYSPTAQDSSLRLRSFKNDARNLYLQQTHASSSREHRDRRILRGTQTKEFNFPYKSQFSARCCHKLCRGDHWSSVFLWLYFSGGKTPPLRICELIFIKL